VKRLLLGFIIFLLCVFLAQADNYLGPRGLLTIPTTDTARPGLAGLGISYTYRSFYANLKATFIDNVELGIAGAINRPLVGFFKWRLIEETPELPAFAVGATGSAFYGVTSKNLTNKGLKGHFGFGTGSYGGFFGGISFVLNPVTVSPAGTLLPVVTIMGEFRDNSNLKDTPAVFNVGSRLQFNRNLGVDIGLLNFNTLSIGAYLTTTF